MKETPPRETSSSGLTVFLAHVDAVGRPPERTSIAIHRRLGSLDQFGVHSQVASPDEADVILFTELHLLQDWRLRSVQNHDLRRRFPERCYSYDERSWPWPALPGLTTSPPKATWNPNVQVPWSYPSMSEIGERMAEAIPSNPDLLFSFTGSPSVACRERIFELSHPRAVIERVEGFTFFDPSSKDFDYRQAHYQEVTLRSQFVLCPRGRATSSIRLYEVLAAGRVPVIFADDWIAPSGPDWERCSVRWPEADVAGIPAYLESIEDRWESMAVAARETYQEWYSPHVSFHRYMEALRPLVERRTASSFPFKGIRNRQYVTVGLNSTKSELRRYAVRTRNRARKVISRQR